LRASRGRGYAWQGEIALRRLLKMLALGLFVAVVIGATLFTALNGPSMEAWGRFVFAGLLLVVLALYGASLSGLKREQAEAETEQPPAQ
jgi:uncharacterized membrane protein YfcA